MTGREFTGIREGKGERVSVRSYPCVGWCCGGMLSPDWVEDVGVGVASQFSEEGSDEETGVLGKETAEASGESGVESSDQVEMDILSQDPSVTDEVEERDMLEPSEASASSEVGHRQPLDEGDGSGQQYAHLVVFTSHKAGMDRVDKEKVNKVVYENSVGSKFFAQAQKMDAKHSARIEQMKAKLRNAPINESRHQEVFAEAERSRQLGDWWCVVDFDMFYAAVEMRDNPSLIGKPVAVGGSAMISTANYEARKFGVRSAMPGFIAKKLCPDLIFVPSHFDKYREAAEISRNIFREIDPLFTSMSLDEASLHLTPYIQAKVEKEGRKFAGNDPYTLQVVQEVVEKMRRDIAQATGGLTCSAGIAPNRMLAKIASDINKPNGQKFIDSNPFGIQDFMKNLPLRKIPGIGKVTEHIIKEVLHCHACGELLRPKPMMQLFYLFKRDTAMFIIRSALGISSTKLNDGNQNKAQKGISCERTFRELSKQEDIYDMAAKLSTTLSTQMKAKGLEGKVLTVKLKSSSFEVKTRAKTLPNYTNDEQTIWKFAKLLLARELPLKLRLMGIRVSSFKNIPEQTSTKQRHLTDFLEAESRSEGLALPTKDTQKDTIRCHKCHKEISMSDVMLHEDWHFAKEIKQKMREEDRATFETTAKKRKRVDKQRSLTDFFKQ